ncbi:MAG: hypothetical protein HC895_19785 [Leptolyngbyaceae cyanobacterium SM1_3_5]|nr:hypothetical protein [Leptolyngbyaceae cyanobacterium SM1_3_5]
MKVSVGWSIVPSLELLLVSVTVTGAIGRLVRTTSKVAAVPVSLVSRLVCETVTPAVSLSVSVAVTCCAPFRRHSRR